MFQVMILFGVLALLLFAGIRIITEYERGVVFRLGRYAGVKAAGLTSGCCTRKSR